MDSISYAQGLIGGTSYCQILEAKKVQGNKEGFYEAFRAGFYNDTNSFMMSREEAYNLINEYNTDLQKKAQEDLERKHNEEAAFNKIKADEFLKKYKEEKNVVALENGVMYKIIKTGYGPKPTLQDTVVINYEGKLIDGHVFTSSYKDKKPLKFPLATIAIEGLKTALLEMPKNSTWEIVIPPELAYGKNEAGAKKEIPSNSALIFKIELMKVFNP